MTKSTSSKAVGSGSGTRGYKRAPGRSYSSPKKNFDAHASKARGRIKTRIRTIENRLNKLEFDLFGRQSGEEE